jgi:hypothetical protein
MAGVGARTRTRDADAGCGDGGIRATRCSVATEVGSPLRSCRVSINTSQAGTASDSAGDRARSRGAARCSGTEPRNCNCLRSCTPIGGVFSFSCGNSFRAVSVADRESAPPVITPPPSMPRTCAIRRRPTRGCAAQRRRRHGTAARAGRARWHAIEGRGRSVESIACARPRGVGCGEGLAICSGAARRGKH